jgi:hypothetical protein
LRVVARQYPNGMFSARTAAATPHSFIVEYAAIRGIPAGRRHGNVKIGRGQRETPCLSEVLLPGRCAWSPVVTQRP